MADMCNKFHQNPTINPISGFPIQVGSPIYNALIKKCGSPRTPTSMEYLSDTTSDTQSIIPQVPRSKSISQINPQIASRTLGSITNNISTTSSIGIPVTTKNLMQKDSDRSPLIAIPLSTSLTHQLKIPTIKPQQPTIFEQTSVTSSPFLSQYSIPPKATIMTKQMDQYPISYLPTISGFIPNHEMSFGSGLISQNRTNLSNMKQFSQSPTDIQRNIFIVNTVPKEWGVAQRQQRGWEDRYQATQIGSFRFFSVFDGHGGSKRMGPDHVGDYCVQNFHERLARNLLNIDVNNEEMVNSVILQTFINFDIEMFQLGKRYGTTCTTIMIDDTRGRIYQINLGDSRSIIFDNDEIISVTEDHTPNDPLELDRIENAGGYVISNRVQGTLALSRAFGDYDLKINVEEQYDPIDGMVSAVPDINVIPTRPNMHIILTSDAPYEKDAFDDAELINLFDQYYTNSFVSEYVPSLNEVARKMVNYIAPRTTDDTTILLINV